MKLIKIISISKLKFFNEIKLKYSNGLELLNDAKLYSNNIIITYNNKLVIISEILNKLSDSNYLENILHILSSNFIKKICSELQMSYSDIDDIRVSIQLNVLIKQLLYKFTIGNSIVHVIIDISNYSTFLIKLYII